MRNENKTFTLNFLNEATAMKAQAVYKGNKDDKVTVEKNGDLWKLVIETHERVSNTKRHR